MASGTEPAPSRPVATPLRGLSEQEALARRARGEGNDTPAPTSRSYRQIFTENVFTFINLCLFGLGITLAILGRIGDALISTTVIAMVAFGLAGFVRAITIGGHKANEFATIDWHNFATLNGLTLLAYALTFAVGIAVVHLVRSVVMR